MTGSSRSDVDVTVNVGRSGAYASGHKDVFNISGEGYPQDEEKRGSLSCCGKLCFFIKQTCKDIKRHKCQFCLSFCSVFVVVLSILIVVSITQKGPIIFLRLSEKITGAYDGIYTSEGADFDSFFDFSPNGAFLNYTEA